jgi:hypothetical protein
MASREPKPATPEPSGRFFISSKQDLKSGPTAEQLRRDIDGGMTGDKVRADDPAGTDDEAAGAAPLPYRIARAILQETSGPQTSGEDPAPGAAWILIAVALGMMAVIACVWALAT